MSTRTLPRDASRSARIVARLERLPFTRAHRDFLLIMAAGEFVETMVLIGNGTMVAMMAKLLHFTPTEAAYVVPSAFFAGEFIGSMLIGRLADRFGRRTLFAYDLLIFSAGILLATLFSVPAPIAFFLFVAGIGVGGEFPLVDTYTTEMFPGGKRGRRIAAVYTIAVLGAPIVAAMAYGLSQPAPGPLSWRILFWIIGALGLIAWFLRLHLPESPRWLAAQGRDDEAERIVKGIEDQAVAQYGRNALSVPPDAIEVSRVRGRWGELFAKDLRGRTIMMLVFEFCQTGVFYGFTALAPIFLMQKGISLVHSLLFTMIIFAGFFVGSLCNTSFIDKVERKWGIVGTLILAGISGTIFALASNVILTVVMGFLTAFILWNFSNFEHTFESEMFPTRVRSTAAGTVYSVSRISTSLWVAIIVTFLLPMGMLPVYGFVWFLVLVVVLDVGIFGPRTSRRRLEDIAS